MLLTIDIGNTNITMGVFEEEFLLGMFRMTTKRARTSDEYGFTICGILEHRGIDSKQIDSVIVASVVPDIMLFYKRYYQIFRNGTDDRIFSDRYRSSCCD